MTQQTVMENPNPETARPLVQDIGVNTVTSTTPIDPTDPGPFFFELQLDNVVNPFLPVNGTVFIENSEDQEKWIFGVINSYDTTVDPTVLVVRKVLTSVTVSESIDAWLLSIVDGPPVALPIYQINGLRVKRSLIDPLNDIVVEAGSVRDFSNTVDLTLPTTVTKKLDAAFAAGDNQGSQVQSADLAGTVSSSGTAVTGVGTNFRGDFHKEDATSAWNADIDEQRLVLGINTVLFVKPIISSGAQNKPIDSTGTDTALVTTGNLGAGAGSLYKRGGWISSGIGYYAIMLVRKDDDGSVDVAAASFNGSGIPDLPAGYTYYRVIAFVLASGGGPPQIEQYLKQINAPYADEIYSVAFDDDVEDILLQHLGQIDLLEQGLGPVASTIEPGFTQHATNAEAQAGAVGNRSITPINLGNINASPSHGLGYRPGAGATVTQLTSKATNVTINNVTGLITLHAAALAANALVTFTVNCSNCEATDAIILNHRSLGIGSYAVYAHNMGAGSFDISVRNITAGSLSQAITLRYCIFRGAST